MEYVVHIGVLISIYAVLAISLDLLAGQTGLVSIAHASFMGLGAYSSALVVIHAGLPFTVGVIAGMTVAAIVSMFVSVPSLRLHDDFFVIATFGFQMIAVGVFNNWNEVTKGPLGISDIPSPIVFGWTVDSGRSFLALGVVVAALAYSTVAAIVYSPLGRVLRAIREDEIFAQSLGKNTIIAKVQVFAVSAAFAALGGALYAHYITYIDPTSFTVTESILMISMVILGGAGSLWGPLVGAATLVVLPEILRFTGLPDSIAANFRQILYGGLLVMMLLHRPRGLVGRYGFGR